MEVDSVLELIRKISGAFRGKEGVVDEYDSLVNYVGSLNMDIGASALSAFEPDIQSHISGKRIYDVLEGFLRSHKLLEMVVKENVNLDEIRSAIDAEVKTCAVITCLQEAKMTGHGLGYGSHVGQRRELVQLKKVFQEKRSSPHHCQDRSIQFNDA
jgi:hypothetical protein